MKDFVKWLGVNEKIAKVVVWLLIIMVMLILTNTMLESLGFPYYKITYDNLQKININKVYNYILGYAVAILNFFSMILLVFRVKDTKKILKYALLYIIINAILSLFLSTAVMQLFVIMWIITFCYLYSGKNNKYILYAVISIIINIVIQGIAYSYKARFIDYTKLDFITKSLLSIDYFIIIGIIILVKEIYLKQRSENNGRTRNSNMSILVGNIRQRKQSGKKTSKKSSKRN